MNKKIERLSRERVGLTGINSYNEKYVVIKYNSANDVIIRFDNGYERSVTWNNFKKCNLTNPYTRTIMGIGYSGEGNYIKYKNYEMNIVYNTWFGMFERCYDSKYKYKYTTYIGCTVCEEWHNFQNFAKWYEENYYEVDGEVVELDKDILIKGNKIYSPHTCCFVPKRINYLLLKTNSKRGKFPIGVHKDSKDGKYIAQVNKNKRIYLGRYNSAEEAFNVYKIEKEKYIKEVANEYIQKIPKNIYDSLLKYEVDIND